MKHKDPVLAAFLNLLLPGIGYIYLRAWGHLLIGYLILFPVAQYLVGVTPGLLLFYLFAVVDAYIAARFHNRRIAIAGAPSPSQSDPSQQPSTSQLLVLGSATFELTGSLATREALLRMVPAPRAQWSLGEGLFSTMAWLLFVEAELPKLAPSILPLALSTIASKIRASLEYGVVPKAAPVSATMETLGTVELTLAFSSPEPRAPISPTLSHVEFHKSMKEDAVLAMMLADSVEAISEVLDEASRRIAFGSMIYGLEVWARYGPPRRNQSPNTWSLSSIMEHAERGHQMADAGWLAQQGWPMRPFTG